MSISCKRTLRTGSQRKSLRKKSQIKTSMSGTFLITEYKPGKMRVVFDCSALYQDVSLNQQLLQGPVPRQRILESLEEGVLAVAAAMAKMDSSAKILTSGWHRNRLRWKFAKEPLETWSRGRNVSQRRRPDQESKSCYCHRFPRWLRQTHETCCPSRKARSESYSIAAKGSSCRPGNPHQGATTLKRQ